MSDSRIPAKTASIAKAVSALANASERLASDASHEGTEEQVTTLLDATVKLRGVARQLASPAPSPEQEPTPRPEAD